jgi:hypothetical protein
MDPTPDDNHHGLMPAARRIGVVVRDGSLYLDADDLVAMLRSRARQYRARADLLVEEAADPGSPVDALDRGLVTVVDEALACRMVAEELEQRADVLERIG